MADTDFYEAVQFGKDCLQSSEPKLDNRDTRKFFRSVKENRKKHLSSVTALLNQNRLSAVSKRTVQSTLYKQVYFRRIVLIQNLSGSWN